MLVVYYILKMWWIFQIWNSGKNSNSCHCQEIGGIHKNMTLFNINPNVCLILKCESVLSSRAEKS